MLQPGGVFVLGQELSTRLYKHVFFLLLSLNLHQPEKLVAAPFDLLQVARLHGYSELTSNSELFSFNPLKQVVTQSGMHDRFRSIKSLKLFPNFVLNVLDQFSAVAFLLYHQEKVADIAIDQKV
jgi:hypothetical protein